MLQLARTVADLRRTGHLSVPFGEELEKKRSETKCFKYLGKFLLFINFNPSHMKEYPCFLNWSLRKRFEVKVFS